MNALNYRRDIDGLRSLAVLPVLFNHADFSVFSGGFVGVDVFFVISGFLITSILTKEIAAGQFSLLTFYERRARRILPALFFVIIACFMGGWFLLMPAQMETMAKSAAATLLFASNFYFWRSSADYFSPDVDFEPLLHTWSLGVEEQFYILFPLLLWAMASLARRYWIAAIAAGSAVSFAIAVWGVEAEPTATFYLPITRAWELGLGALLAVSAARIESRRLAEFTGLFGLILIAGSVFLISDETPFPGLAAIPPCLGAVFLIWSGSARQTFAGKLLSLRPLVFIGLISYSLYLWHWPILVAARIMTGGNTLEVPVALAGIAVSILLAWISWAIVEQPFRKRLDRKNLSRKSVFVFSAIGAAALLAGSFAIVQNNGVESRLPAAILEPYHAALERDEIDRGCMDLELGEGPCQLGVDKGGAIDVLVWGDSHAGAMLPGINQWLLDRNLSGAALTSPGCSPLIGVQRKGLGGVYRCGDFSAEAERFIESRDDFSTVILAARWALAAQGQRAEGERGPDLVLARIGEEASSSEGNFDLLREGLGEAISLIQNSGRNVVLIGSVPEMGVDIPTAFTSHRLTGAPAPTLPSRVQVDMRQQSSRQLLGQMAEMDGVELALPVDHLCNDQLCKVELEAQFLYRGDNHLSAFGARWLMPQVLSDTVTE